MGDGSPFDARYVGLLERSCAEALKYLNAAREADPELLNDPDVTQARAFLCMAVDGIEAQGRQEIADA